MPAPDDVPRPATETPGDADREAAARSLTWVRRPRPGVTGSLSPGYLLLDRVVVAGEADRPALVAPGLPEGSWSCAELLDVAARLGGALRALGAGTGERVLVRLSARPEAALTLLACARTGAVAVPVAVDASAEELAALLDGARPAVVVTGSGAAEVLAAALARAGHAPAQHVVVDAVEGAPAADRDVAWELALTPGAAPPAESVVVDEDAPLVRLAGGDVVAGDLVDLVLLARRLGVEAGDVVAVTPATGWAVARATLVPALLLAGATVVLAGDETPTGADVVVRGAAEDAVEVVAGDAATTLSWRAGDALPA